MTPIPAGLFRKKSVVVQATQWFRNGDHPQDYSKTHDGLENGELRQFHPDERRANGWDGDVVRYYRNPDDSSERACQHCGKTMHVHGWIDTKEGGHIVCPGDWIITGVQGEHYPCKPYIFAETYELAAAPSPASVAPGDAQDAVIAGALFDLMGFLTTLDEPVALGSTEEAAIAVELLQCWAAKRGLNLDGADVKGWKDRLTGPAAGDALDAKRYRWLREKAHQTAGRAPAAVLCDESDMFQRGEAGSESGFIHGKDLDDAIDAALAAQVPQQGEA